MKPLISVKIPTYNCAEYLIQTIKSILNQKDFDLELLEIEVIDDCSNLDNPEEVVNKYGQGKVRFYRQPQNVGAIANFNTCIKRSFGEWIHILHGDDIVTDLFYSKYVQCINTFDDIDFISSRVNFININNDIIFEQSKFNLPVKSPFKTDILIKGNTFATPSVVVKKSTYYELGFFKENLNHTADWEMWSRILFFKNGLLLDDVLSSWRDFLDSDTKKVRKNGNEIRDHYNAIKEISNVYNRSEMSYDIPRNIGVNNCRHFLNKLDFKSFYNNYRVLFPILNYKEKLFFTASFCYTLVKKIVGAIK